MSDLAAAITAAAAAAFPAPGPRLLPGGLAIDDRGHLAFHPNFDPASCAIRRWYLTSNHRAGLVRAWHGHRREQKWVTAVSGAAKVAAVKVDDWNQPDPTRVPDCFVLSASQPAVLAIPAGWANGWMSLTPDCTLAWFSTATLAESRADDVRFPARTWDCWKVEER